MKNNEFDDLKQGFQETIDFIKDQTLIGAEVDTFMVKRRKFNQ